MSKRPVRWFSVARGAKRAISLGVTVAGNQEDRTVCVLFMLFFVWIAIGPHYEAQRTLFALPRR